MQWLAVKSGCFSSICRARFTRTDLYWLYVRERISRLVMVNEKLVMLYPHGTLHDP